MLEYDQLCIRHAEIFRYFWKKILLKFTEFENEIRV